MRDRHIDYAIALAKSANCGGFHFGSVIYNKKQIISCGWCQQKSHPLQARYISKYSKPYKQQCDWLHAEMHAIISARRDLSDCSIIVARWSEKRIKPSFPCDACQQAINVAGIKNVVYYTGNEWRKVNVY